MAIFKSYTNLKQNKIFRKDLRQNQTRPEQLLWFGLRKNRLNYKFRRQHGIDKYIVDFYCHKLRLIIEIDGSDHDYRYDEDMIRQSDLEAQGYKILRYRNDQVEKNLEYIIEDIKNQCEKRKFELEN